MANSPGALTIRQLGPLVQAMQRYGQQLFQPPDDKIRGIDSNTWFSPLQPVEPFGPPGTEPRAFQYWSGQNLLFTPRADAEYSALQLRALATYPLARICIENVKDTICAMDWVIQPRRQVGETRKQAIKRSQEDKETTAKLVALNKFFERPDREHSWDEWLRPLLEDLLTIDAPAILIRKTFKGDIVELPVLRGDSIVRYIDDNGFTPMPPSPAYAQNWWGMPLVNLTTDQLVYKPRNIVPRESVASQLYGYSPTEAVADEIKIGIERLKFVLAYYTEGSIPGVVQVVPKGTQPEKIAEAMAWMNSELAGNLAARRQWRMVQGFNEGDKPDQIIFSKEELLSDPYDDLHIRKMCFSYGTSPQRLMKQMNRASSEQADDASQLEGTLPFAKWLMSVMNYIIQTKIGRDDFEFNITAFTEPDEAKHADTTETLIRSGVITPNEGRERHGEEKIEGVPEADMLGTIGGTFTPLAQADRVQPTPLLGELGGRPGGIPTRQQQNAGEEPGKAGAGGAPAGPPKPAPKPGAKEKRAAANGSGAARTLALKKNATKIIKTGRLAPQAILAQRKLTKILAEHFASMHRKVKKELAKRLELPHKHIAAAQQSEFRKADEDNALKAIQRILAEEWRFIADEAQVPFDDAVLAGVAHGAMQLDITDEDMLDEINQTARDWAADRSAEFVGMKWGPNGRLTQNPDPRWAVSDTTRDDLRAVITDVFEHENPSMSDIEARIMQSGIFSDLRASMIARTEISMAQTQGNLESWRQSGLVEWVDVQLSADHDSASASCDCDDVAEGGPYRIGQVPYVPVHPNCNCAIVLSESPDQED